MKQKPFYLLILILILFSSTAVVFAQTSTSSWTLFGGGLEISLPFISAPVTPASYLSGIYKLALILAVIAALGMIITAGITYATSGDNVSKQKEARDQIKDALIGLVLIFASVLILRTINPDLINLGKWMRSVKTSVSTEDWQKKQQEQEYRNILVQYDKCINICNKNFSNIPQTLQTLQRCKDACQQLYPIQSLEGGGGGGGGGTTAN